MSLPKILVASPTAVQKNYCLKDWLENTNSFTYPNYQIRMFDNTPDLGINSTLINTTWSGMFGKFGKDEKFFAQPSFNSGSKEQGVIERMAKSHNDCRIYALENGYTHLLHLESDVFPPHDVIERLLMHRKQAVGAVYYRDMGRWRKPMLQRHIYGSPRNIKAENFSCEDDLYFMDGSLKKVASVGLGCVLIERSVLEKIPFRFVGGEMLHPDAHWSHDLFVNKIPIYCDTSLICEHRNEALNWSFKENYD